MSLLDDARRLAQRVDPVVDDYCEACQQASPPRATGTPFPHASYCPWLSLPKIVAALEAAQEIIDMYPDDEPTTEYGIDHEVIYVFCEGNPETRRHSPGCQWLALKGEVVPSE